MLLSSVYLLKKRHTAFGSKASFIHPELPISNIAMVLKMNQHLRSKVPNTAWEAVICR